SPPSGVTVAASVAVCSSPCILRAYPARPSARRPDRLPARAGRWSRGPPSAMLPVSLPPASAPTPGPRHPGGPMSETTAAATDEQATIYTAYEIDFMLGLRDTENGRITREQVGLRSAPEAAREFVTAAVTSGLRARGKVERSEDGQWLLGEEGQVVATALTAADRWLGIALAEGEAMRMAFIIKANDAIVMLTQDELDSFAVTALPGPEQVPASVADIVQALLDARHGRGHRPGRPRRRQRAHRRAAPRGPLRRGRSDPAHVPRRARRRPEDRPPAAGRGGDPAGLRSPRGRRGRGGPGAVGGGREPR